MPNFNGGVECMANVNVWLDSGVCLSCMYVWMLVKYSVMFYAGIVELWMFMLLFKWTCLTVYVSIKMLVYVEGECMLKTPIVCMLIVCWL